MSFARVYPLSHLLPEYPPDLTADPSSYDLFLSFFKTSTSACVDQLLLGEEPGLECGWYDIIISILKSSH